MSLKFEEIARICHEVNKSYCESLGDFSQVSWESCPDWQKNSVINGVIYHINNKKVTPEESHINWLKQKESEGWCYGKIKDVEKKQHPCFLPYDKLPLEQRSKDYIFKTITDQLSRL